MRRPAFSPDGYAAMMAELRDGHGYTLLPVREACETPGNRVLLLRHDVDLSLDLAIWMAEREHAMGIRATYMVLPFNDFYNPLSPAGRAQVRAIHALGHEIGLHWDSTLYPQDAEQLARSFCRDVDLLQDIIGEPVLSASQHIPIDSPLIDVERLVRYETSSRTVRERFAYVSDSAMAWRGYTPLDLAPNGKPIHFCAHPIWWFAKGETRAEKFATLSTLSTGALDRRIGDFHAYVQRCLEEREALDRRYAERLATSAAGN